MFSRTLSLALVSLAAATPISQRGVPSPQRRDNVTSEPYTLPQSDSQPVARAAAITVTRAGFLYGPAVGGGPFYPTGPLGDAVVAQDIANEGVELGEENLVSQNDSTKATLDMSKYNNLETLQDYTELYDNEWVASSFPTGVDPGILSNYTQDLLFSMERLSFNPYVVRRLDPTADQLPFTVANATIKSVSGSTLQDLHAAGRLFYADYRNQGNLTRTNLYAAACDGYFYINSKSGNFLPLAIRTNFGNNLIYTPADQPTDWLLAKIMYNVNDFFMGQLNHLAQTHDVVEIVYEAAIRTLSADHPILAIFQRLMYEAFSLRPLAAAILFSPGGKFDQFFGYSGSAAGNFSSNLYTSGYAGAFQSNYFQTNLINRGLLNSKTGPALKHFPFYEDASVIYNALHTFMTTFVNSYYTSPAALAQDTELQAWIKEAVPAQIIDFPTAVTSTSTLVDMLTHIAFLISPAHHTVNTNQLITDAGVLPFHPAALYQQVPTSKGVTNIVPFLPGVNQSIAFIGLTADFSRPKLAYTNRSLVHMFDDPAILSRMNSATQNAAAKFKTSMTAFSNVVGNRTFGADGLSQGMPFVWKALDPMVIPYSLSI